MTRRSLPTDAGRPTGGHADLGRLLRLQDVADRCQVSLRTVQGWVSAGRLRVVRLSSRTVRVTEEALAEFLDRAKEGAT